MGFFISIKINIVTIRSGYSNKYNYYGYIMEIHFYSTNNLKVTGYYITLDHKKFWSIGDPNNFMHGANKLKKGWGWHKDATVGKYSHTISTKTHPELFI